eukprot:6198614-Pleurochrysis_carterae.AAC.6
MCAAGSHVSSASVKPTQRTRYSVRPRRLRCLSSRSAAYKGPSSTSASPPSFGLSSPTSLPSDSASTFCDVPFSTTRAAAPFSLAFPASLKRSSPWLALAGASLPRL